MTASAMRQQYAFLNNIRPPQNPVMQPQSMSLVMKPSTAGGRTDRVVVGANTVRTVETTGINTSNIPGAKDFIGPLTEIDSKILFGRAKPGTNNIIGGHSPDVLNSTRYQMDSTRVVNADETISVTGFKGTIVRKDGIEGLSKAKAQHTIAPPSWSNVDVLQAGQKTAAAPGTIIRDIGGVQTTVHTSTINGVQWVVIKDNGVVTSSFPTGGRPFP